MRVDTCADRFPAKIRLILYAFVFFISPPLAFQAAAQEEPIDKQIKEITNALKHQEMRLAEQDRLLRSQQDAIARQAAIIESQRAALVKLQAQPAQTVVGETPQPAVSPAIAKPAVAISSSSPWSTFQDAKSQSVALTFPPASPGTTLIAQSAPNPSFPAAGSPVGEAPVQDQTPEVVQSLPGGLTILTPAKHFIFTPSVEYTHTNNDRLVFEGVVLVPGINIGQIEASTDDRNIVSEVADLRYGINDRLEVEARVPFTFADDRPTITAQNLNASASQSTYLHTFGIGDVEFGGRYQINDGRDEWPIFVANARVKTDTGIGPFDILRDASGVAQQVALGSGFVALEGGFSMLKLSDPVVLYGSANYVYEIPKNINQTIGNVFVGSVDPGSSINANLGFGFAVNPEFSFSFGYEHSYVFPQFETLASIPQESYALQVGALTFGMAYRLNSHMSLNANFEFGVTADAPDVRAVFSVPITF